MNNIYRFIKNYRFLLFFNILLLNISCSQIRYTYLDKVKVNDSYAQCINQLEETPPAVINSIVAESNKENIINQNDQDLNNKDAAQVNQYKTSKGNAQILSFKDNTNNKIKEGTGVLKLLTAKMDNKISEFNKANTSNHSVRPIALLWTIAFFILLLWLLGLVFIPDVGGLIHLLLVIFLILLIVALLRYR